MEQRPVEIKSITPERAVEMLRLSGLEVTTEQAREILALLSVLAKLEVEQYLNNENS